MQARNFAEKIYVQARKRLGLRDDSGAAAKARFAHRQATIWDRAFAQAERNGRIAVLLGALLALSLALNIVQQGRPANVIFVDQLGNAKYFPELASPEPAKEHETVQFSGEWVKHFLSRHAATVDEDVAQALTVTASPLREALKAKIVDSGELEKAKAANVESLFTLASVKIVHASDERKEVRVEGARTLKGLGSGTAMPPEPFAITLLLQAVERGPLTPNGLMVKYVAGNFGGQPVAGSN